MLQPGVNNPTLRTSRSLDSIRAVWVSFFAAGKVKSEHNTSLSRWKNTMHIAEANAFHTPEEEQRGGYQQHGTHAISMDDHDFIAQLSVGNKRFPDYLLANPSEMHETTCGL